MMIPNIGRTPYRKMLGGKRGREGKKKGRKPGKLHKTLRGENGQSQWVDESEMTPDAYPESRGSFNKLVS